MRYSIMRLQYTQEQSRQTILPGLELFYEHPPFLHGSFSQLRFHVA